MTANNSKSYLNYLVIAIILIVILLIKNLLMLINQLWLEKLRQILKLLSYQNIFSKDYTKNWSREIFIVDSVLKTNPWFYKTKDLNGEKIIGSF